MRTIVWFVLAAAACCMATTSHAEEEVLDRIAAVIGRDVILQSEVDEYVNLQTMETGGSISQLPKDQQRALRCQTIQAMVDDRLLVSKARLDSIEVSPQEVEAKLKEQFEGIKARFPSEDAFQQQLVREGTTERELRNKLRQQMERYLLRERLLAQLSFDISVSFRELEQFYEENKDSLPTVPASVTIAHITRVARPGDSALVAARVRIQDAQARIRAGEDFGDVARVMSQDPGTAPRGGDLGFFGRGEMVPEFETIAFSLDSGEVSAPVLTEFGLHLIQNLGFRGTEVHARHILARAMPSAGDRQATLDTMQALYDRLQNGANFDEIAREYSMDPEVLETGGRVGPVSPDALPAPFGRALSTLESGDVSMPFESQDGTVHLVKLIKRTREHKMNLTDDRKQFEEAVRQQKLYKDLDKILEHERERTYVDIRMPECGEDTRVQFQE